LALAAEQQAAAQAQALAAQRTAEQQAAARAALDLGQQAMQGAQLTGQLGQSQAQTQLQAAQAAGALGLQGEQQQAQLAGQMGQLGLGYGQLAQQDVAQLAALGQGVGSLGVQAGNLGTQIAGTGMQQAQLGQALQQAETADIARLMNVGAVGRSQEQAALDAQRLTEMQEQQFPYQQYSYMSDILSRTPSAQQTMTTGTQQAASPFQQVIGTGIAGLTAAAGAQRLGLFS
jgi:hypothetical protein